MKDPRRFLELTGKYYRYYPDDHVVVLENLNNDLWMHLESYYGVDVAHLDESGECEECSRYLDFGGYGIPDYVSIEDGGYICRDCALGPLAEEYLKSLVNQPNRAFLWPDAAIDFLTKHDFYHLDQTYTAGYGGYDEYPADVYNRLKGYHPQIVFVLKHVDPFRTDYTVWVKDE